MRDMILDTNILPEQLFRLIPTEKMRVHEAGGMVNLIPFVEKDSGCPLWGIAKGSTLTTDKFIAMKKEERELDMLAEKNPLISRAVVKLRELSADEKARDLYERREKERRDDNMRLNHAVALERQSVIQNMRKNGMANETIAKLTGFSLEEVMRV